jgi:hypothetical protein
METIKLLRELYRAGKINKQQLKTYRGQVLSGNESACLVGMKRKGLI